MRATGSAAGCPREVLVVEELYREDRAVEGGFGSAGWRGLEQRPPLRETWKGQPW